MNKKAIYLDINADLSLALNKLEQVDAEEIILVIPRGSALFHSPVNLKILQASVKSKQQTLALVTLDQVGRALAAKIGIPVYDQLDLAVSIEATPIPQSDAMAPAPNLEVEPIPQLSSFPTGRRVKIKYQPRWPEFRRAKQFIDQPRSKTQEISLVNPDNIASNTPSLKTKFSFSILFILLALVILGGVIYFVLPKASISLEVKSEPFNHKFKLVLADQADPEAAGQNVFKGRFVEVAKEVVQTFPTTGSKNKGNPASGVIVIYNYTKIIQGLIPQTRFVSPNGLVFRISQDVLIAPARAGSSGLMPGRTKAKVVADTGGSNGNLPVGTKLIIPGLKAISTDLIYGKNDEPFVGGTDNEVKIISEEDIKSARESISKNVFFEIENELQKQVKKNEELIISLIQNDIIDSVPSSAVGAQKEAFDLRVQIRSWTLLPTKDKLTDIISNSALTVVPNDKMLTPQTLKSARIVLDNADFLSHIVDFTVELDGLLAIKLDNLEIVGSVANRSLSSADKLINSLSDVVSHKIVLWPFWVHKLPLLESNIKITTSYVNQ